MSNFMSRILGTQGSRDQEVGRAYDKRHLAINWLAPVTRKGYSQLQT